MKITVTGHRPQKLFSSNPYDRGNLELLKGFAKSQFQLLQPEVVYTGMALGWDMACAMAAANSKIPFIAAIPFQGQEKRWIESTQQLYQRLLLKASRVIYVDELPGYQLGVEGYHPAKLQKRNEWMVDQIGCGDRVLALWDGSSGGTANCVNYAASKGVQIENVWHTWRRVYEF